MTSKLVVNTIEADTGISSVSFASSISMSSTSKFHFSAAGIDIDADTNINRPAAGVLGFNINGAEKLRIDTNGHLNTSGIVTAANFKSGVTNVHNLGVTLTGGQLDVGSNIKIGTAGVVTATSFSGSGANLTNLPVPTTITVADESTDTTCNPLFVTTTSGNLAPKTGTNLTFNSSSGNFRTGSLFLGTATNESKTQDGLIMERNSGDGEVHISAGRSGGNYSGMQFYVAGGSGVTKRHQMIYDGSFRWYGADGTTERLRIDSSGNLMIGMTNGSKKFSIKEASTSSGVYYNQLIGGSSHLAGYAVGIGFDPEGYPARTKIGIVAEGVGAGYSKGKLHFLLNDDVNSSEASLSDSRMSITDSGDVSMSAPSNYTDPYRLHLRYRASSHATLVIDSRPDVLSTKHIRFYYALHGSGGGSELGSVTSNNAGSVNYNTSSDYRRKQNDVVITDGIAKVKNLRPIRFNWIEQPDITEEGFFAHEAQEVVPNSVFGAKDAVDKDGNPDYQVMDHSKLVPLLTASIKDLIAKVETLEAEVAALKGS